MNKDKSAVEVFLKSWHVYQEIVRNNYMFHDEISNAVRTALANFKPKKNLTVLDLGCGDGSMTFQFLHPERVASYTGCDLSESALEIAQRKISQLSINAHLLCDDMMNVIAKQPTNSVDLIFSSYAVHHLDENNKLRLIEDSSRCLNEGGKFILIDIFREPNEDRAAYMRHYLDQVKSEWLALSTESQELVINHAEAYDFPEQVRFYKSIASRFGLDDGHQLAKHRWHEAWAFTKCI